MLRLGGLISRALAAVWLLALVAPTLAQEAEDADALSAQVIQLYQAGKYAEAIPIAERALAIDQKRLGLEHPRVALALNNLAFLYHSQGRYAEAEPLYQRSLAMREKALGPGHPDVALALNNLAELYRAQGRYGEAEPFYQRSLAIREKALGSEHPDVAQSLNNLALLYDSQGQYAQAEPLYKRSLVMREKALGSGHPDVAQSLNNLAALNVSQGRYAEAEPLYKRSLAIREKVLGPGHPNVALALGNLAELYRAQGRYGEAEPLYKRSLAMREKALGPGHPDVATSLSNLALLYHFQGHYAQAEPLYQRSLDIWEKSLGAEHPRVATALNNLVGLYDSQDRFAEAIPLAERSLAIREKALGPEHPGVARSLNNLAALNFSQGRYAETEPLYKRSLAIREKALGPEHPDVATALNNLAGLYDTQGRYSEAEPLYQRSLAIREKALGPEHPDVAMSLNNLAFLALAQNDLARAAENWRRATGILERRAERGLGGTFEASSKGEAQRSSWYFEGLVKVTQRVVAEDHGNAGMLTMEMFKTAQWAQSSEAATTLAQMAVRETAGDATLSTLVRERQDLVGEWQAKDKLLVAARSQTPDRRDAQAEKALADRLAAIDTRLAEIDAALAQDFPDYAALAIPKPVALARVQSLLADDEVLMLFLDTDDRFKPLPEETFVWVVTKTDMRWVRSDLGTKALQEHVAALRCGLDDSAWAGEGRALCAKLLGLDPKTDRPRPLPFDLAKAHELYQDLFGEVEDLIKGKHLLIVPSGALTALPFQVLVTKPVAADDLATAAWLVRDHALTVLPSVASLEALRRGHRLGNERPVTADTRAPFIGFGNPQLDGTPRCGKIHVPDTCPDAEVSVAVLPDAFARVGAVLTTVASYFRNGQADVAEVRKLCPLPDTAHELVCVAKSLGAPESSIVVGKAMTESAVKRLPLDHYRVVHFATHGLLAGETAQLAEAQAEPALVFSPPDAATAEDDGLLTASEVASLKLDADWVVMSACNTAGGGEPGAEALSGLAKAFFYAGARALMVSHWPVNSYAATVLTSRTFAEMKTNPDIGRSEAFRRAMLALMSDDKRPWAAHPSVWAPFVVVGEGGAQAAH